VKRFILLLAVSAILVLALAVQAFAFERKESNSQGSCVGKLESRFTANGTGGPGSIGFEAKDNPPGTIGDRLSTRAHRDRSTC